MIDYILIVDDLETDHKKAAKYFSIFNRLDSHSCQVRF
jgi:hypothetical protein